MNFRKAAFMAGAGALFAIPAFASANFSWDFTTLVSGDDPGFSGPWAHLDAVDVSGGTQFTLTFSGNAPAGEFLGGIDMNYDGNAKTDLSYAGSDHPEKVKSVSFGDFTDAGSVFNIDFNLLTTNKDGGTHRVNPGESITFTFDGASSDSFNLLSTPNGDGVGYLALLHVQGLPNGGSAKVAPGAVPEPASMGALAIGALGLIRRKRKSK
jgi:hypothetical protein